METIYYNVGFAAVWFIPALAALIALYIVFAYFRGLIRSMQLCYNMIKRMDADTRKTVSAWRIVKNIWWAWNDMTWHNIKTDSLEFKDGTRMRFWF